MIYSILDIIDSDYVPTEGVSYVDVLEQYFKNPKNMKDIDDVTKKMIMYKYFWVYLTDKFNINKNIEEIKTFIKELYPMYIACRDKTYTNENLDTEEECYKTIFNNPTDKEIDDLGDELERIKDLHISNSEKEELVEFAAENSGIISEKFAIIAPYLLTLTYVYGDTILAALQKFDAVGAVF